MNREFELQHLAVQVAKMKRKSPPTKTFKGNPKRQKKSHPPMTQQARSIGSKGPERKNIDLAQSVNVPLNGTFVRSSILNGIAQGTSANQRVGRKIRMKDLILRWEYVENGSTGGGPLRIKIIYDKQSNGASPSPTDVFEIDSFTAFNNLAQSDRFVTLVDIVTEPQSHLNNPTIAGVEKRKIDLEQMWSGATTGTSADSLTGSIFLYAANTGTNFTATPILNFQTRIRFTDY